MNPRYIRRFIVLFFIFATGSGDKHRHSNISLFNKNICKRNCSIVCVGKASKIRRAYNPHSSRKDVLRKYFYIINVVVIYIILSSL